MRTQYFSFFVRTVLAPFYEGTKNEKLAFAIFKKLFRSFRANVEVFPHREDKRQEMPAMKYLDIVIFNKTSVTESREFD